MVDALLHIILFIVAGVIFVLWVAALLEADGHCHYEDCGGCPYAGECTEQERKAEDE